MKRFRVVLLGITMAAFSPLAILAATAQEGVPLIGKWERVVDTAGAPPMTLVIREFVGAGVVGTLETRRGDLPLNAENSQVTLENGRVRLDFRTVWANYNLWHEKGELSGKELVLFGEWMNREFNVRFEKK